MATINIITGTASAVTKRVKAITGSSPASSRQLQNFGGLSSAFAALNPTDKATWQAAANTLNTAQARLGRHTLSAANAFNICNSGRFALNLDILSTAPQGSDFTLPPALPPILVNASSTEGQLTLTLTSQMGPVSRPLQILAEPPQIAGKPTCPDKLFAPIGALPSLASGTTDIAALYIAKYGIPEAGCEICLRLVATSEVGLRRAPLLVTAICADATVAATETCQDNAAQDTVRV